MIKIRYTVKVEYMDEVSGQYSDRIIQKVFTLEDLEKLGGSAAGLKEIIDSMERVEILNTEIIGRDLFLNTYDRNGDELYENDIVSDNAGYKGYVTFNKGKVQWVMETYTPGEEYPIDNFNRVFRVGNRHELGYNFREW